VVERALRRGLILNGAGETAIRILPRYDMTFHHIDQVVGILQAAILDIKDGASSPVNKGGIDFNPDYLEIQKQEVGPEVWEPMDLEQWSHIEIRGLVPVIINVTPVINLPLLMGALKEEEEDLELSSL